MLTLDGSTGEGGGQILRTALALSCVTGTPFRLTNIRAGRRNPGLQPQHLASVLAARDICSARVLGDELGSREIEFRPGPLLGGTYDWDVAERKGSAGSVSLVLQAVFLPLCLADVPSRLRVKGGTHVPWSPPVHYVQEVFLPMIAKLGGEARVDLIRWGWYPAGGGEVEVTLRRARGWNPLNLQDRGALRKLRGISAVSNLPRSIADRQAAELRRLLREAGEDAEISIVEAPSPGKGTFVFLVAEFEQVRAGFGSLGARGKPSEEVAREAFEQWVDFRAGKGALDEHLADQILPFLALAPGPSAFTTHRVTNHLLTGAWVVGRFLPREISVSGKAGEEGEARVL
ncbi:MAG: RNA 3'-phosphate cyclase [Candidatus Tectomicrobia bacterium]|uniref:RNA 3'-terminal phosphate cyclase n=1 Tax=Tectimicrobiota bacterium TaxID=2528274 RepID=A0A932GPC2_UNCTE|nr:RNA 3'-phosphate cyclase [Candidatus Tectomicrobia bacterium]